jgi:hypothetical protein
MGTYKAWNSRYAKLPKPIRANNRKKAECGFSWTNIHALPGYTIDHVDFEFEPHGHAGFEVPDYNIHAYYVSPAVQATICPNGKPRASMRPMNE